MKIMDIFVAVICTVVGVIAGVNMGEQVMFNKLCEQAGGVVTNTQECIAKGAIVLEKK